MYEDLDNELEEAIKTFGRFPDPLQYTKRFPLNVCDRVAQKMGYERTVVMYNYGEK